MDVKGSTSNLPAQGNNPTWLHNRGSYRRKTQVRKGRIKSLEVLEEQLPTLIHQFIYKLNTYLSTYFLPGKMLDARDPIVSENNMALVLLVLTTKEQHSQVKIKMGPACVWQ